MKTNYKIITADGIMKSTFFVNSIIAIVEEYNCGRYGKKGIKIAEVSPVFFKNGKMKKSGCKTIRTIREIQKGYRYGNAVSSERITHIYIRDIPDEDGNIYLQADDISDGSLLTKEEIYEIEKEQSAKEREEFEKKNFEEFENAKEGIFDGFKFVDIFHKTEKYSKYNSIKTGHSDEKAECEGVNVGCDYVDVYFFCEPVNVKKQVRFNRSVYCF